jgi:hypothetical protein
VSFAALSCFRDLAASSAKKMPDITHRSRRIRLNLDKIVKLAELADYIIPFTIRAICELGIADLLQTEPKSVHDLAKESGSHTQSLLRALRALACKGIFTEVQPLIFAHTPMSELLTSAHPLSLKDAFGMPAADIAAWTRLDHALRTGTSAFEHVHGQSYWSYLADHPDEAQRFDRAQAAQTRLELRIMLRHFDWGELASLVDIGGGDGTFAAGILAKHVTLRGIVFDSPTVIKRTLEHLAAVGVQHRCSAVAGSFFEAVPEGADGYVLKRILYGWDDAQAAQILRTVAAAMRPDSRLLIIEPVRAGSATTEMSSRYDLAMMVMKGCGARDLPQLQALLAGAGLVLKRLIETPFYPILEVVRKELQGVEEPLSRP